MVSGLAAMLGAPAHAQRGTAPNGDPVQTLVTRLDLEKYKDTIKGLTQFGDRLQGTQRNRDDERHGGGRMKNTKLASIRWRHLLFSAATLATLLLAAGAKWRPQG